MKWCVAEGDHAAAGDTIAEIETDMATVEYPGAVSGRVM